MKLIVLGSGTCVPSVERNAPGYYLGIGESHLLVDCGSGTVRQLERAGKSYRDIDEVYITHTHTDHVADLLPLLHALSRTPGFRREKELRVVGPAGLKKYYKQHVRPIIRTPGTFQVVIEEITTELKRKDFQVLAGKTVHSARSTAYRFSRMGRSIVITGDCDYDESLVTFSRDADLLVIDCSFPKAKKSPGHLSSQECGIVAARAGVKKVILSHIYPTDHPDDLFIEECGAAFDGEVVLAEDLLEVDL